MAKLSKQDRRSYGTHQSVATSEDANNNNDDVVVLVGSTTTQGQEDRMQVLNDEALSASHPGLPFAVYLYSFCAALNSCNLGYDIGVSTNAGPLIQKDFNLSDAQLELFLGSLNFWSIFGALLSPYITDRWGRRTTFCVAALGFCIGISIMATSGSFEILMAARAIVGIGVGIGEAIDPMYISEMAPPSHRGELVSWAEAGVSLGVVLGFMSSLFFWNMRDDPNSAEWRYMVGLGALLPLVMLVLVWKVMPESPRWLLTRNQPHCTQEARKILECTYPVGTDVDQVMEDIQESLKIEEAASQVVGWKSLLCFPSPAIRRMLVVGVGIAIIQQAVGIDAVMFYLVFVIRQSGITSDVGQLVALIILGTVKLLFVFVGAKLFDQVGRRIMLFISLIGCAGSLVVVSFTFGASDDSDWSKVICILGLASYLAFFSTGLGPGNWVVVSEVFATSIRAKAMSIAVFPNRVTATIMASSFLSVSHLLTWPGFFLLLAGICIVSCLFLYIYLPETKGKTLEEMAVYFAEITGDRSILDAEEKVHKERAILKLNTADGNDHACFSNDTDATSADGSSPNKIAGGSEKPQGTMA